VTIFSPNLKPTQVVVGTAAQAGACRTNAEPFAQLSDGGYFASTPGSITVIGRDGSVRTKPVPSRWIVVAGVLDGDGLLVRDANSNPLDYTVYQLDRTTGTSTLMLGHVKGFQPVPQQSIDVSTFGALGRTDWSWWNVSYQLPYMVAMEGVAGYSTSHISRSFFDPEGGVLAEVSASTGDLLVGDARGVRGTSSTVKAGSILGPIYEVIVRAGTMAVSAKGGVYLATMSGVTKLGIPKVAPLP
jgi:hypothetical protein